MVAVLIRYFGLRQVELAEDVVQETLLEALDKWSVSGIPDNPEGWLMDVAKKKTINYLKRNQNFKTKILPAVQNHQEADIQFGAAIEKDSTLRMIFTCCHPSLPDESQVALALKTLCGLSISEIANALLTNESNINKRLYRAKQKFRNGSIAFEVPDHAELERRLDNVFATLYLLFNEGYYSARKENKIRMDFCYEAIRLLKQIIASFPENNKALALMSLMLLNVARFESRIDREGALIVLSEQDRTLWDQQLIAEGVEYLQRSTGDKAVNKYQLQAGIAVEHCIATSFEATNWESIYRQYGILEKLDGNVIILFNKAIARFFTGERAGALDDLNALQGHVELRDSAIFHMTIGIFYTCLQLREKARSFFEKALSCSISDHEKLLIQEKMNF